MKFPGKHIKEETPMINKLIANIKKTGAPIVVGLDPMLNYIPKQIQEAAFKEFGETLEGAAEAIWQYNKGIVDATYDLIPAVKPQIAMYEQFGIPGLMAYKRTVDYCKEKDLVVIGDIKRGDIGSTSAAYAVGHLGKVQVGSKTYVPFNEDFATVNPYLGTDGVKPFMDVCKEEKKGIFVLVKTSNPSSGEFQDRIIEKRPLYEWVGEKVAEWGADFMGDGYSYVGAVVGATYPEGRCNNIWFAPAARTAADYISKHWPYPILFFTNNVGGLLVCGAGLQQVDTERKDIVTRALYAFGTDTGRLAWDPFGVWCAGYACGKINRLGFKRVNIFIDTETGRNTFTDATDGKHYVIYPLCNNKNYYNAMMDHLLIKKAKL